MNIYIELLLVGIITIYIVDVSGFTHSWRSLIARLLGTTEQGLRPLPPFDCGQCASWWATIIYAIVVGEFSLVTLLESALIGCLSIPLGQVMIFIREGMNALINLLLKRL